MPVTPTTPAILAEGKTKVLRPGSHPNEILVTFKNDATAFNGLKHENLAGKGLLNATISSLLFEYLESHQVLTCYLGKGESDTELRYRPLKMLPLEVVVRNYAYGSICKRLGFEQGRVFPKAIVEYFWKVDALDDPQLTDDAIELLEILPEGVTLESIRRAALVINDLFVAYFTEKGIRCADFKLEFGVDTDGVLRLGDELSPDNFRLRDAETGEILDKDVFRHELGDLVDTYQALLNRLTQGAASAKKQKISPTRHTYQAEVRVKSRKGILNPESKTILGALRTMGFNEVEQLQAGKRFTLTLQAPNLGEAEKRLKIINETLLSNPIIEETDYILRQV